MRREFMLYLGAAALGFGFIAWLSGRGGDVELRLGEWLVAAPLAVAAVAFALFFLLGHGVLAGLVGRWRRAEIRGFRLTIDRRAEADRALTEALVQIALGAPDAARAAAARARELSGGQPVALLVSAAAERLAGQDEAAAAHYRALAADPATRVLGLRGLLRQAAIGGDRQGEQALLAAAGGPGDDGTTLPGQDLQAALAMAPPDAPRAERLLGQAAAELDPDRAAQFEREAFAADPRFTPAALAHAARLAGAGHAEAARAVLEVGWAAGPHPDIAEAYLAAQAEPAARLAAAEALARHFPNHIESRVMLARAAMAAGRLERAQAVLEGGEPDRRAHQALAEIARRRDDAAAAGRHLDAALAAPAPPGWLCEACGAEAEHWSVACRACGAALTIRWAEPKNG